jgi:hypothetical protein
MASRRQILGAIATSAVGWSPANDDMPLLRLVGDHHRFDEAILAAEDEADALLIAGRQSGGKRSAAAEAACARAEALHEAQGRVANAIINMPAATLLGVAYKLIVWRKEAAISFPDDFDGAHESFTFSAYRDLLRLTGLSALEHPCDRATLARMKRYWIPS